MERSRSPVVKTTTGVEISKGEPLYKHRSKSHCATCSPCESWPDGMDATGDAVQEMVISRPGCMGATEGHQVLRGRRGKKWGGGERAEVGEY